MRVALLHLLMYRWLKEHRWPMQAAVQQMQLWKDGVRDHRIADDTMAAYEAVRYDNRRTQ